MLIVEAGIVEDDKSELEIEDDVVRGPEDVVVTGAAVVEMLVEVALVVPEAGTTYA